MKRFVFGIYTFLLLLSMFVQAYTFDLVPDDIIEEVPALLSQVDLEVTRIFL